MIAPRIKATGTASDLTEKYFSKSFCLFSSDKPALSLPIYLHNMNDKMPVKKIFIQ